MIIAGFGFRGGADLTALESALTLAQHGHPPVTALATLRDKSPALTELAQAMGLPLILIEAATLKGIATLTNSAASLAARGTGSVAEAVALAAAGPGSRLLAPRHISPDRTATCAIAEGTLS